MKKRLCIVSIALLAVIVAVVASIVYRYQSEDADRRRERDVVYGLIKVGQDLTQAEETLRQNGYSLVHDQPIRPTKSADYLSQIVVIGDTEPTALDNFFYATTGSDNPLRTESPYVVITARNDGAITQIE